MIIKNGKILGVVVNQEKEILGDCVVLATGHSARDMFYLLHKKNIKIEAKDFAMGVRIEHPQALINEIQYHTKEKNDHFASCKLWLKHSSRWKGSVFILYVSRRTNGSCCNFTR